MSVYREFSVDENTGEIQVRYIDGETAREVSAPCGRDACPPVRSLDWQCLMGLGHGRYAGVAVREL